MADFEKVVNESAEILEFRFAEEGQKAAISMRSLVNRLQAQGISRERIRDALLNDLVSDGAIFGTYNRGVQRLVGGHIGALSIKSAREIFIDQFNESFEETWVCVLVNTCRDCIPRHGRTERSEVWDLLGRPPEWGSVCDPNCQCQLIPKVLTENRRELMEPLRRARNRSLKEGNKEPEFTQQPRTLKQRRHVRELGNANA